MDQNHAGSKKKWLLRAVKLAIVIVVACAVGRSLHHAWQQLGDHQWQFQPFWLAVSAAIYLLGILPPALFWHRVLRVLGQDAHWFDAIRAYYIGHLGKYVPGKAMVVVLRAGLIRGRNVDTSIAAVSVFVETLTMMAAGSFLAATILVFWFREQGWIIVASLIVMVLAGLPTIPPLFRRLARLAGVGRSNPAIAAKLHQLHAGTLLQGWLAMMLSWGMLGFSYWAVLRAMDIPGLDPIGQLPRYIAAVTVAVVAGFLLLVLPGGVGGREFALVQLMTPYLATLVPGAGVAAAWASAALLRLVWLVSELAISGILYYLGVRVAAVQVSEDP